MSRTVTRPALRYFGGKWRLAPRLIRLFPPHRIYVEPYGGAASVLLRKPRCHAEIYNDLDTEVVGLFRVLRDPRTAAELRTALTLTPFARDELKAAYDFTPDPVENARRLIVRSFQGFGSNSAHTGRNGANSTGFRSNSSRSGTTPAHDWSGYPDALPQIVKRLTGVTIENKEAVSIMRQHDRSDTLHFVDPPYLHSTRARRNPYCKKALYRHELNDEDHAELLAVLLELKGMVVVSGYASRAYDQALRKWQRTEFHTYADGARPRTEVVWRNPAAVAQAADASAIIPLFPEMAS